MPKPPLTEVEEYRPGTVQKADDPQRPVGGDEVKIGHAASEQWVSLAEIVVDVQTGHHRREPLARLVHPKELGDGVAQCLRTVIFATTNDRRHCVAQHAGSDRMPLGVVGVEQAFRR